MLRRHPTRIELKLEDLEEFEEKKQERKQQNNASTSDMATPDQSNITPKTKRDMIHERIGYDPQPLLQPSRLPIH